MNENKFNDYKCVDITEQTKGDLRIRKLTSEAVLDSLQKMYSGGGWAFIREFKLGTGRSKRDPSKGQPKSIKQRIDAIAYNTWPSAHEIITFEVKCSRQDFLNEIATPRKREAAMSISDKFYFVAPPGIIMEHEVPEDCGLIIIADDIMGISGNKIAVILLEAPSIAPILGRVVLPTHVIHSLFRRLARAEGTYVTPVRAPRKRRRLTRGRKSSYSRRRKV